MQKKKLTLEMLVNITNSVQSAKFKLYMLTRLKIDKIKVKIVILFAQYTRNNDLASAHRRLCSVV